MTSVAGSLSLTEMLAHLCDALANDPTASHQTRLAAQACVQCFEVMEQMDEMIAVTTDPTVPSSPVKG
jgi:hypothetical protein